MLALMAGNDAHIEIGRPSAPPVAPFTPTVSPAACDGVSTHSYKAREDMFLEGDEATHVLEVLDGVVCAYRLLPDGQRHIASFYFPGDLIGYCCLGKYPYSAQALTTLRVRRIPRASMDRMVEHRPEFARRLLKIAASELTATRDHLLCLASKSAEAKMASFLLALARRNQSVGEDPMRIVLPMTRVDIGDYLGLTIETVSRTLSKLKRQGIISLPRTSLVVIRQLCELEAIAQ